MSVLMDLLLLSTACTHVLLTPYTKVEESFNLHGTHDVLMYGVRPASLESYDHFVFPGAVPRTLIGSILLAWLSSPLIRILSVFQLISSKADLLVCVRLVLTFVNAFGLSLLRRAIARRFGYSTSALFVLLTCTQFHLPFWMGRTLPNMFALLPVNLALYMLVNRAPNSTRPYRRDVHMAIALLLFAAVVFRAELALFLASVVLQALFAKWTTLASLVRTGLLAGVVSMTLTVLVDSYFWDRWPLWPELYSVYFNVYQGKSADWGVSPFHTYLTGHLPKLALSSLPLAALGVAADSRIRSLSIAPAAYVLLISMLAHKEWRFVVYVVPLVNVAAARGARWMLRQRTGSFFGRACSVVLAACLAGNLLVTYFMTEVSRANYPGGVALSHFNVLFSHVPDVHVHIADLAAQTGASLFLHKHAPPFPSYLPVPKQTGWVYNKTENLTPMELTRATHFTHLIVENPAEFPTETWEAVECIRAFAGIRLRREQPSVESSARMKTGVEDMDGGPLWDKLPLFGIDYAEKLCILERKQ